jgi:hypothetical protein
MPYLSLSGTSQAAPVVTGTIALMLQANPSLTPNAVKAILQYTAEMYPGHSYLEQGAGFLNARGAVDLSVAFNTAPPERPASPFEWSRQIIWANRQLPDRDLIASATAWDTKVAWGDATDAQNNAILWGSGPSVNVVWGDTCNGVDCEDTMWATSDDDIVVWGNCDDGDIVVWGNSDDDIVVWGNSDDDIVVWGNSGEDPSSGPVIWPE